ncbi:MAG: hypothetical protein ACK5NT_16110 [Pyrinomonadaceae bacterium]
MKKLLFAILLLVSSTTVFPQLNTTNEFELRKKGNVIVSASQTASGTAGVKIQSIVYRLRQTLSDVSNQKGKPLVSETEIILNLPNKIRTSTSRLNLSESIEIWNGEKFKSLLVIDILGNRSVMDTTNRNSNDTISDNSLSKMEGKIDKKKLDAMKSAKSTKKTDPKVALQSKLWTDLFPLILSHPFESNLQFKYIGKAESKGKFANVVDVTSMTGQTYRLFFDSETNLLLMMTYNRTDNKGDFGGAFDGYREYKYYFTNREKMNGLLIPRQIKGETIFKPKDGAEVKHLYTTIEVEELQINPEINESIFEIK